MTVKAKAVKDALGAAPGRSLRLSALRRIVSEKSGLENNDDLKAQVKTILQRLQSKGKVTLEGKVATLADLADRPDRPAKRARTAADSPAPPEKEEPSEKHATPEPPPAPVAAAAAVPGASTRLFLGNLSFRIDEAKLKSAVPGITHIKWITDKATQQFYGTAFVEMENLAAAAAAVGLAGSNILGRPIKANYAPARPGDIWPPPTSETTGGGGGGAGGSGGASRGRALSEKPYDGCRKLFIGNLSYEIEDSHVHDFFADCGEVQRIRWLTHRDTEEFRGCGYIEFSDPNAADKAVELNGKSLLNRPIRIDWDSH